MWIYALGVTLRQTLSSSSTSSPLDSVIMDNQQQPGNRRRSSSSSQEQLNGDYYQSDRQKTGSYSSCGINGRGRQREWDSNNDRKTNTPGEWIGLGVAWQAVIAFAKRKMWIPRIIRRVFIYLFIYPSLPPATGSTLEFVINSMCNRSLELRASLMYLLDVSISRMKLKQKNLRGPIGKRILREFWLMIDDWVEAKIDEQPSSLFGFLLRRQIYSASLFF